MKKTFTCFIACLCSFLQLNAQDLPNPSPNLQTLPAGSYVIAMDNSLQTNSAGDFNLKAYGLIVYLLDNNVKVKWAITAGKSKDGIDFTATAEQILPSLVSPASNENFKAGPFVVFASDTTGVAGLITSFYSSAGLKAGDCPKVYRLTTDASNVDIRYDLSGFIPKAAILTDGKNQKIHLAYMTDCSIPADNYATSSGSDLLIKCFTFASEPHNDKADDGIISTIRYFVQSGGDFLAQCAAIETYENASTGRFQTTNGITVTNASLADTSTMYPNADLAFSQYEGSFNINQSGSVSNWIPSAGSDFTNNENNHATGGTQITQTPIGASVSKLNAAGSKGGLVFYLGSHKFSSVTDINSINGIRMYMNAFLTPVAINNNCRTADFTGSVLPVKLSSFYGTQENGLIQLNWNVQTNESLSNFELQKSNDGFNFIPTAFIEATRKTGNEVYEHSESMNETKVYYRLKMTEKTGAVLYSKIISFTNTANTDLNKISVINDPYSNKVTINIHATSRTLAEVSVANLRGMILGTKTVDCNIGNNSVSIELPSTTPIYVLHVSAGNAQCTEKIVKQ